MSAVVCTDVDFSWPDGDPVFTGLTTTFGGGRSGPVGVNGSGKSTLLRLVAGALRPTGGTITVHGELGYVPQDVFLAAHVTVEERSGLRTSGPRCGPSRAALRRRPLLDRHADRRHPRSRATGAGRAGRRPPER